MPRGCLEDAPASAGLACALPARCPKGHFESWPCVCLASNGAACSKEDGCHYKEQTNGHLQTGFCKSGAPYLPDDVHLVLAKLLAHELSQVDLATAAPHARVARIP